MPVIAQHHVQAAMRDGTLLSADIYRPDGPGPFPTVLTRTCYTKTSAGVSPHHERGAFWAANCYAYIVQDVRGRGDSDGVFYPLVNERDDGSDTIDWIASQPWSDGRVVMLGGSYLGWTQVYAALSHNPKLVALAPAVTPTDADRSFPMSSGMIMPAGASWLATITGHTCQDLSNVDMGKLFAHRPIVDIDKGFGRTLKAWRDWVDHPTRDEYWEAQAYQARLVTTTQPMLHISGWYDDCLSGALENFSALSQRKLKGAAPVQRLLVGPWLHSGSGTRAIGDFDYGEQAVIDLNQLHRDWFDECLKGEFRNTAPVRLFVMGRNAWIEEQEWPVARTEYVPYYLHSDGRANTRNGDGTLSTTPPDDEPADRFRHDPLNPVPYTPSLDWRQVGGPDDCTQAELRDDILVYTGPVLTEPLLVCGPLRVRLFAATSARDTDWTAKVLDVHPDGKAIRLNDGAVRARFRKGHQREALIPPGSVEEFEIDCWATCIELAAGHRLRLEIASSAFGKYDVNLGGGGPIGHETEPVIAEQTIHHDAARPSRLVVPVLRA